ncbi:glutathione S-transferase N-terminal domain-containing protein [Pseudomonas cannabina]|uniref:Glutathione S-transferase n=3 Tax=Pseudomonas syringae group TaxID=136849 RepID=A0A3M3RB68_PSECA|nr:MULTISPECIES: glutathione S-transferase [Pseudomonas syringae group]KPW21327.1 putative glutathione S-transferase [Pseudomonas cannabina pv. alisalensis]MBM0138469.1 glutathione S-transferase [Pseudomonas cannabina pv. alisalensis]QHE97541.1 glutathione S-transferase [Pseudomonas syringae pv. maculicola str. ES4326]QQN24205.1 glutathione S-transferase [Pseudomonas cannabina pv. alisalensis]RMN77879.1 putative glutathione S-transferase [Pseudomonas cannabina]
MYTLFGSKGSGSAAIEMALERCAVPFTLIRASSWEEGPGKEALRRVNPLLQVPTLVLADGTVLTESAAILIHLGLEHSRSSLLPGEASARAQALRGLVYIATNCYAPIGIIDYPERWLPGADDAQQAALEEGARTRLHENWETFAELFGSPARFRPDTPGAMEILAAVVTRWSGAREHLSSARPAFYAALLQVDVHPTVRAVTLRHWGPAA